MDRHDGFARNRPYVPPPAARAASAPAGPRSPSPCWTPAAGRPPRPRPAAARRRPTLNVTWTNVALPTNIDPAIGFDSDTLQVVRNVYEGLLEYAPGSTTVRPALAKSYSVSPDGTTYTFQLRPNVVFHDGTSSTRTRW